MIIAVDFDGTLCEHMYPEIGNAKNDIIDKLIDLQLQRKIKLILWTCRDGIMLEKAVEWCKQKGLFFDAVNDDLPEIKASFTYKSHKVYADIYLDDRNETLDYFLTMTI